MVSALLERWCVEYWIVTSQVTLIRLQGHLSISSENKCCLLFQSLIESPYDLMNDDIAHNLEWRLKVISGTVNGFIVYI